MAQEALIRGWLEALGDNTDAFAQVTVRCEYKNASTPDRPTRYARNVGFFTGKTKKAASKG